VFIPIGGKCSVRWSEYAAPLSLAAAVHVIVMAGRFVVQRDVKGLSCRAS